MEILALKLLVSEEAVNRLLAEHVPKDVDVRNLRVRIVPEGVRVLGEYPTVFLNVAFETLWTIVVADGQIEVRLADVKVSGFPATMLRGVLFKVIRDVAARQPGVSVQEDALRIDLDAALIAHGLPLKVNLRGVLCSAGSLAVAAGSPT